MPMQELRYGGYIVTRVHYARPYWTAGGFVHEGFVISKEDSPGINSMPGAAAIFTMDGAIQCIDILNVVDGDAAKFWHLHSALQIADKKGS